MILIEKPIGLPGGSYRMYQVSGETEADKILNGRTGYFFRSKIIAACYLFIPLPVEE